MAKSKSASAPVSTNLHPAFIGAPVTPIKIKADYKPCFRRLPFVAPWRSKSASKYWDVPATGGYQGGYETGEAMALTMLKHLRDDDSHLATITCSLTQVVESFMERFSAERGSEMLSNEMETWSDSFDSFRGQYCGFFNTLTKWLAVSAKASGNELDVLAEEDLVARANAGLGFNATAYMASLT